MVPITLTIRSRQPEQLLDITAEVERALAASGLSDGLCHLFVRHTTAGVLINENADPAVCADALKILDRLVPQEGGYAHAEGNTAAHVKSILVGTSHTIPVHGGKLALGTWQGIFFCEFDGPRTREMLITFLPAAP